MVWTWGSFRNLPCPGADAVWDRRRALNPSRATGSGFNLEYSFWDYFMHCLAGHTASNSAMFLRLNRGLVTDNSCFRGIAAAAGVVPACGWTEFLGQHPDSRLLQACTHCSMARAACYCIIFTFFCCTVLFECLVTCYTPHLPVHSPI